MPVSKPVARQMQMRTSVTTQGSFESSPLMGWSVVACNVSVLSSLKDDRKLACAAWLLKTRTQSWTIVLPERTRPVTATSSGNAPASFLRSVKIHRRGVTSSQQARNNLIFCMECSKMQTLALYAGSGIRAEGCCIALAKSCMSARLQLNSMPVAASCYRPT